MNSNAGAWQKLGAAWRNADWNAGVGILRPIVEELPEVLSTRLLLAGFATEAKNPGLALLHYEKLLVLSVGQGELFHALAAERGLDGLRPGEDAHRKRIQALQQWFKTVPPRARGRKHIARLQSWMVDRPAADFRRYAEASRVVVLPAGSVVFETVSNVFAIVLHGSASWTCGAEGEMALPATRAASGEVISAPPECKVDDRVNVQAAEPGVLLCFDGEGAAMLRDREAADRAAVPGMPGSIDPALNPLSATPQPSAARESGARPEPDPVLEPLVSRQPPAPDRRREHELIVRLASEEAELGIAGTRTGAIVARLAQLSPAGLTIIVPRATVRQSRAALEGAHIVTRVTVPGDEEPLRLAGRVTGLIFEPGGFGAEPRAQLAIEFVLLLAPDRARLQEALIEATRDGQWPSDPSGAATLAESRAAA